MTERRVVWSPQPGPQTVLCACPIQDVFYGGARGGGKSDGLLGDFIGHAAEYGDHAHGLLLRKTFPMLAQLIQRSLEIYQQLGWRFNHGDHVWTAPNGATLRFGYLDGEADAGNYIGHEYTWLGYDQVEDQADPRPLDRLWGSLRSPHGVPILRRLTGNPPAPAWVKQRYIDPHPRGLVPFRYQPLEDRPDLQVEAVYIESRLEHNPLLVQQDPGYEARLAAVGDPRLFEAWRHARWDIMMGQVFEEWRSEFHVLERFQIPKGWERAGGLDWGYRAPGWFGLAGLGYDGEVVVVDELYFRQKTGLDVGRAIGLLCRQYGRVDYIAGDEQMWYKTGSSAPTIAEEVQQGIWDAYGGVEHEAPAYAPRLIEATHGRGSRLTKLQVMHRYLHWTTDKLGKLPPWGVPKLRFTRNCQHAIRTIPTLPYDPHKPEDVDTTAEDHPYDGVAALLMSRPESAERPVAAKNPEKHPGFDRRGKRKQWEHVVRQQMRGEPSGYASGLSGYRATRFEEGEPLDPGDL